MAKLKFIILYSLFIYICTSSSPSIAQDGVIDLADIENKLLSRDLSGAKLAIEKTKWNNPLRLEVEPVITCVEKILWFYTYLNQEKDINAAIAAYSPMMTSCNDLPDPIPFSEKLASSINDSISKADKFIQKECGKDYGQIRVGMSLSRVQKCVAEFFLRGQINTKNGVVDHYTRGDSWMYVKKGKVVAWGD